MSITLNENETIRDLGKRLDATYGFVGKMVPVAYWYGSSDESGQCTELHLSEHLREMLGYKAETEFPGSIESFMDFMHPDDVEIMLNESTDTLLGKTESYNVKYRVRNSAGKYVWCNATGERVLDSQGNTVGMYGALLDISLNIQLEEEIERSRQAALLEEKNKELEEIISFNNFFLGSYVSAIYVDLNTMEYTIYKEIQCQRLKMPGERSYHKYLENAINICVHPDDRNPLISVLRPEKIRELLKENSEITRFFRVCAEDGERQYKMKIMCGAEEGKVAIGFRDVTGELAEQNRILLGATTLSSDIYSRSGIGFWAYETDGGKSPRLYTDSVMRKLLAVEGSMSPEEIYRYWYDRIDAGYYRLFDELVLKTKAGEHAEIQYPWHRPDGGTVLFRVGAILNPNYKAGMRLEGTFQNVSEIVHLDEEERNRAEEQGIELVKSRVRLDALNRISYADTDTDVFAFMHHYGDRVLEIVGCDQLVFTGVSGERKYVRKPGIVDFGDDICSECAFSKVAAEGDYDTEEIIVHGSTRGCGGVCPHRDCPVVSSLTYPIFRNGELFGMITGHFTDEHGFFTEIKTDYLQTAATYCNLLLDKLQGKQNLIERIKAESSDRAKSEFLFKMSHDIRTPMNAILGYTDIALNHIDERERVSDSLVKIKASGNHLLNLINDILEMSRIEAGKLEIVNAPLYAYEVTGSISSMSNSLAITKDIEFRTIIDEMENPYFYGDELHVNQILMNIISNAIKYTSPGGHVEYRFSQLTRPVDGIATYRMTVKDDGIGMSEDFQKHLFESFSREARSSVSRQEGAGLGLAIVKNITDLIGGTITVESSRGVGSTFTVDLPFKVMDDKEIAAFRAEHNQSSDLSNSTSLTGRRVLIVEDNEMNREIAKEIMEDAGLAVHEAADGALAVQKVKERGADYYDFILMDIQMPVMDGYEATREIRKLPQGDAVPIIALSANAFEEDREKSVNVGMNAHVAKPIDISTLISAIKNLA